MYPFFAGFSFSCNIVYDILEGTFPSHSILKIYPMISIAVSFKIYIPSLCETHCGFLCWCCMKFQELRSHHTRTGFYCDIMVVTLTETLFNCLSVFYYFFFYILCERIQQYLRNPLASEQDCPVDIWI